MAHELEEPEVIRQRMESTRQSLAGKLESLEQHVLGTVQETTAAVADTAEKVTEAVGDTVDSVKDTVESVKETFDLRLQVERHPWIMLGGAVAAGYALGRLLPDTPNGNGSMAAAAPLPITSHANGYHEPPPKPSYLGSLLAPELDKVKALALGAVFGLVRDLLKEAIPPSLKEPVRDVMDNITNKLGGEPIRGSVLAEPVRHS